MISFYDIIVLLVGEPTNMYEILIIRIAAVCLGTLFFGSVLDLFMLIAGMKNQYGRR